MNKIIRNTSLFAAAVSVIYVSINIQVGIYFILLAIWVSLFFIMRGK